MARRVCACVRLHERPACCAPARPSPPRCAARRASAPAAMPRRAHWTRALSSRSATRFASFPSRSGALAHPPVLASSLLRVREVFNRLHTPRPRAGGAAHRARRVGRRSAGACSATRAALAVGGAALLAARIAPRLASGEATRTDATTSPSTTTTVARMSSPRARAATPPTLAVDARSAAETLRASTRASRRSSLSLCRLSPLCERLSSRRSVPAAANAAASRRSSRVDPADLEAPPPRATPPNPSLRRAAWRRICRGAPAACAARHRREGARLLPAPLRSCASPSPPRGVPRRVTATEPRRDAVPFGSARFSRTKAADRRITLLIHGAHQRLFFLFFVSAERLNAAPALNLGASRARSGPAGAAAGHHASPRASVTIFSTCRSPETSPPFAFARSRTFSPSPPSAVGRLRLLLRHARGALRARSRMPCRAASPPLASPPRPRDGKRDRSAQCAAEQRRRQ